MNSRIGAGGTLSEDSIGEPEGVRCHRLLVLQWTSNSANQYAWHLRAEVPVVVAKIEGDRVAFRQLVKLELADWTEALRFCMLPWDNSDPKPAERFNFLIEQSATLPEAGHC